MLESRPRAVVPRHAASLIAVRDGASVLMGMRGARHRFMPNRLVFPGGAVDRGDSRAHAAAEPPAETLAALGRAARPSLARALCIAAARELMEETGLSLGMPPDLSGLDYLCRAVTPPGGPMRFNARFLVVDAARLQGELAGSGELEDLDWFGIEAALQLDLALVTREVLQTLQVWLAMPLEARRARPATPVFRLRRWREE
jgi:8-oxo-dGTP pyrophosphatase MutT (NUDIX family)